jgi:hypothetical protein
MNKYLFIPPFSNHAPHVHKGWITSYMKRIRLNCTKFIDFLLHKHTFLLRLLVQGYDLKFLPPIFNQRLYRSRIIKKLNENQHNVHKYKQLEPKMIFKIPTCSRTCRLKDTLKTCLRYTKTIKMIRNKNKILGQSTNAPILCYKGGKKLGNILVIASIPE